MAATRSRTFEETLTEVIPSLPAAEHHESHLMALPIEIRTQILQHVLLSETGRIKPQKEYRTSKPLGQSDKPGAKYGFDIAKEKTTGVVMGYNLAPAVLRTCQLVLKEGLFILYRQNTLGIGMSTNLNDSIWVQAHGESVRWNINNEDPTFDLDWCPPNREDAWTRRILSSSASKFRKIGVLVDIYSSLDNYSWLSGPPRRLMNAFRDAVYCLQTPGLDCSMSIGIDPGSTQVKLPIQLMQYSKQLRCKNVIISDIEATHAEEITRVVTGDIDLRQLSYRLRQLKPYPIRHSNEVNDDLETAFAQLEIAALNADSEEFRRLGGNIISLQRSEMVAIEELLEF